MLYIDDKRLLPAPFVSLNKSINFSNDGRPISSRFNIVLNGTLLPNRGSPMSYGWHCDDTEPDAETFVTDNEKHESLLRKQELLREALSTPGAKLSYSAFGEQPVSFYPRLESIEFAPDPWVIKSDYTISLQATTLDKFGSEEVEDTFGLDASGLNLQTVTDSINVNKIENVFNDYYTITREVSAVALANYGSGNILYPSGNEPWENAKLWVINRLASSGYDNHYFNITNGSGYNYIETENIDKVGGSYGLNQQYLYTDAPYIETRNVSFESQALNIVGSGSITKNISVNGVISGLDNQNDPSGKLVNALERWNSIGPNIGTLVGANGAPKSSGISYDYENGIVNYNINFTNSNENNFLLTYNSSITETAEGAPALRFAGSIQGQSSSDNPIERYQLATSGFASASNNFYELMLLDLADISPTITGGFFPEAPSNRSVSIDRSNGVVNFDYLYPYDIDGSGNYIDTFTIEYNTEGGTSLTNAGNVIRANIRGSVRSPALTFDPTSRFTRVESAWNNIESTLYNRVNNDFSKIGSTSLSLGTTPITKSVTVDRYNAVISYNAEFTTGGGNLDSDVATLDLSVDEQRQADIFAVQAIPGRTVGPIIQNISTRSEVTRSVNLNMILNPKNGSENWAVGDLSTVRGISDGYMASGLSPDFTYDSDRGTKYFVTTDADNWDWRNASYTRTYTIVYPS